jgi:hypothetical protein
VECVGALADTSGLRPRYDRRQPHLDAGLLVEEPPVNEPIACIANELPDVPPCTVLDTHWADQVPEDDQEARERHLRDCRGCIPKRADVGFVCRSHFARIDIAAAAAKRFFATLDGVDHAIRSEAASRGKPGSQLPIPPVPLDIIVIRRHFASFTGTTERWVASKAGAADAVRFARAFRSAERNHPVAETSHEIRTTRCPRCGHRTLLWNPPTYFMGLVTVTCTYEDRDHVPCGFQSDQTSYERLADLEANPRPTPAEERTLVFAKNRHQAVAWAREQELKSSAWVYIGSESTLRGMSTRRRERIILDGFHDRADARKILDALEIADMAGVTAA